MKAIFEQNITFIASDFRTTKEICQEGDVGFEMPGTYAMRTTAYSSSWAWLVAGQGRGELPKKNRHDGVNKSQRFADTSEYATGRQFDLLTDRPSILRLV